MPVYIAQFAVSMFTVSMAVLLDAHCILKWVEL